MKNVLLAVLLCGATANTALAGDIVLVKPYADRTFIEMPEGVAYPEGLSANPATGEIFVSTFNVPNAEYNPAPVNALLRYSADGALLARSGFSGPTPLVGIKYNAADNHIYMASLGDITGQGSKILRIDADFDANTPVEVVADIPFIGTPSDRTVWNIDGSTHTVSYGTNIRVPNDIIFNSAGDMLVSDSFQGAVFRMPAAAECAAHCQFETLVHDPLLSTAGFPSFGANGLALDASEDNLYIANTGDDRVLKLNMASGNLSVFAEGVNGADGMAFDAAGYLWVTANQADQLIALNQSGRVVAQLGSFRGVKADGSPRGLLFPASLEITGNKIFLTNMAQIATPQFGDEPEELIQRFTVSEIDIPFLMRNAFLDDLNLLP